MREVELRALRAQTRVFIGENPSQVTLHRVVTVPDGGGGRKPAGVAPVNGGMPQTMRVIIQSKALASRNIDGEEIKPEFVAIAEYTADIQRNDTFTLNGREYKVVYVRDDRRYETWVEVEHIG